MRQPKWSDVGKTQQDKQAEEVTAWGCWANIAMPNVKNGAVQAGSSMDPASHRSRVRLMDAPALGTQDPGKQEEHDFEEKGSVTIKIIIITKPNAWWKAAPTRKDHERPDEKMTKMIFPTQIQVRWLMFFYLPNGLPQGHLYYNTRVMLSRRQFVCRKSGAGAACRVFFLPHAAVRGASCSTGAPAQWRLGRSRRRSLLATRDRSSRRW